MGCGLSDLRRSKSRRTAAVEDDSAIGAVREKPKVKLNHGKEARLLSVDPKVVFIFGGPGSKKGTIVNELICTFGFTLINAERIILHKLLKNQSLNQDSLDPSALVRNLLKVLQCKKLTKTRELFLTGLINFEEQPELVSLDWVMQEITRQLDKRPKGFYLVDMLPNLKVLLKLEGLLINVPEEMEKLESKFPVSFVINIEKSIVKRPSQYTDSKNQKKNKNEEDGTQQTDEADFSRTEKRLTLYANAVKPFLDYFKKSEKIISVDSSSGNADVMWSSLRDFLMSHDMHSRKSVNTVIYFAFTTEECLAIRDMYVVNYLCLKDYMYSKAEHAPLEKVFRALGSHITQLDFEKRNFLVDMTDVNVNAQSFSYMSVKKPVLFFEITDSLLKKYLECRTRDNKPTREVKTVVSTENEVYLFSRTTNSDLCKNIAWCLNHHHRDDL